MDDELEYFISDLETSYTELVNKPANIDMKILDLEEDIKQGNIEKVDDDLAEIMAILDDIINEARFGKKLVEDTMDNEEFREKLVKEAI